MLTATIVTTKDELLQIHKLNQQNIKCNVDEGEQAREGFVSWLYPPVLLQQMHELAPTIIVKDDDKVVGYALTTLKESSRFHPDLETMFRNLETVEYKDRALFSYRFYCMGQICIAKEYRGKGIVNMLYQKHKEMYSAQHDFILTEISTSNRRSIKAHEKIGFTSIYTYRDTMDEWSVVIWNWI
jgi:ribosomal protein S18 acetylase RimI-like enzyme